MPPHTRFIFLRCGLYVIDGHGDEREAGGIDEDIDDRPENVVGSTEAESHLHHILYRQSYHGENAIQRERSYCLFTHLTYKRVPRRWH